MVIAMMLATVLIAQDAAGHHVRGVDQKIDTLLATGLTRSATFRKLVDTLDRSDVVVFIQPKMAHDALGAYLTHRVIAAGPVRYLFVALNVEGDSVRLIPLLAHELQHAVEVAQDPRVRDERSLDGLFDRLNFAFGCNGTMCTETKAAVEVEAVVKSELKSYQHRSAR